MSHQNAGPRNYVHRAMFDQVNDEFKNFHRLLCERFGYVHDPIDWKRDQLSLIEHIATQTSGSIPKDIDDFPGPEDFGLPNSGGTEHG